MITEQKIIDAQRSILRNNPTKYPTLYSDAPDDELNAFVVQLVRHLQLVNPTIPEPITASKAYAAIQFAITKLGETRDSKMTKAAVKFVQEPCDDLHKLFLAAQAEHEVFKHVTDAVRHAYINAGGIIV